MSISKNAYSIEMGFNSGGPFVEFYTDDDGGSGYGDNPKVQRWYGQTEADCRDHAKTHKPLNKYWLPL